MSHKLKVLSVVENLHHRRKGASLYVEGLQRSFVNYRILEMISEEETSILTNSVIVKKGLWNKECGLNYLLKHTDSEYIAWVDADVMFTNPAWVEETVKALQEYPVVQMFSWMQNVHAESNFFPLDDPRPGYYYQYKSRGGVVGGIKFKSTFDTPLPNREDAHPGLAWAARREVLEAAGGFLDWNIMSGADFLMAAAFLGKLYPALNNKKFHPSYVQACLDWEMEVTRVVHGEVGFVPGIIHHYYHGPAKRHYNTPSDVFEKYQFDPFKDIVKDANGFYSFTGRNLALEEAVKNYVNYRI